MNKTETATTRSYKRTNDIIEDHGDWLLVDISTPKFPEATMAVDTDVFKEHKDWCGSFSWWLWWVHLR